VDILKKYFSKARLAAFVLVAMAVTLSGCQLPYYWKQASGQMDILRRRVPIEEALKDPALSETDKAKIVIAEKARQFGHEKLGLADSKNYSRFAKLDRPYVTYVVNAAEKWQLKSHLWDFPFVGKVPYKGYFTEQEARDEEKNLKEKNLDTYVRGVSAYSTLGWFEDPILSSMLRYKEYDLVNTIIHETTHATLYIKSSADFNEQLAVFVGNTGTEQFYLEREGAKSQTLKKIREENEDEKKFGDFIGNEIRLLDEWYKLNPEQNEEKRMARIAEIQGHFVRELKPKLKTDLYGYFPTLKLNNARLMLFKTYTKDLSIFEKLYRKLGSDMPAFISACKKLEKSDDPETAIKEMAK
jgi:predicted aminopeptidase